MRRDERKYRRRAEAEAAPLDPVALTLAVWLGVMVAVTGLIRLSESAATARASAGLQTQHASYAVRPIGPAYAGF